MAAPSMHWLPPLEGWPEAIRAIEREDAPTDAAWAAMRAIAGTQIDFLRVGRLDRALLRLFGDAPPAHIPSRPIRVAVLGSSTTTHLPPAIRIAGLRHDLHVTAYECDYGQYRQDLIDDASGLRAFAPTAMLFALDAHHLLGWADAAMDAAAADAELQARVDDLRALWQRARDRFGAFVIQQTVLPVFADLMGSNEARLPGSAAGLVPRLNALLANAARADGVALLAIDAAAARDGLGAWHDPVLWHRAKQEVSPLAAPMYGELVARLLAAAQGRSAKCLVLDLDNTLWGGVIGDDGLEGIVVGQGSPLGEAFAGFQAYAAALSKRGIILALCSKNDEANALAVFDHHPEMILRRGDVAAFAINWGDKAANLRAIAQQLNIGLDSLVFADDSPFERNLVRRELPMVAVPELPDDPALYARCLSEAGYFESLGLTDEDRARGGHYQANRARAALQADTTDMASYLASLDMRLIWRRFDRTGLQRVTQLINKTNQFNLTTTRMTEDEVAAVIDDPRAFGLQLRLIDRFGDNGIIAIVIGRLEDDACVVIETWLMSCRVLGRRVEEATLGLVIEQALALGGGELVGIYRPTAKNEMVADHYRRLGFTTSEGGTEDRRYRLPLDSYRSEPLPIAVEAAEPR